MKKTALLLAVMLVVSLLALSSCEFISKIPVIGGLISCSHEDANNDHNCDKCGEALSECSIADGSHSCHICGTKLSDCAAAEGSHNCAVCGTKLSDCADSNGDCFCDVCGKEALPENMERVSYSLNISDLEAGKSAVDLINGKFTIVANTEIRNRTKTFEGVEYTKSVKIGANANMIKVSVPGTGKLSFLVQNGSSGADMQFITVTGPDGTAQDIEFMGKLEGSPVVKITVDVTEGEWIIGRGKNGGTQDIFALELSCIVEKSEENGFELVSAGNVDYLCGQTLDLSGIRLNATFANGKTEPLALADVNVVDSSLVNLGQSGTYPVTISYKEYTPITININVYLPVSVELGFDGSYKGEQSAAGNTEYVNQSFKEVYAVGETFSTAGLYVSVVGKLGEENTKTFANVSAYTVSEVDLSTAGEKELTVSYSFGSESISAKTSIHVVDTAPSIVDDAYQVKVDASYTGTIGAVEGGFNMFTTVQQALDFLATSEAGKRKIMIIEEGLYTEKLEITIPNLHIKGVGADKVTIEWDSLYGLVDAGGFSQITDSTQTVAVRDSATGVTIEGVTISNFWNSQDRMDAAGLGIERGLALLVQADRFIMRDSKLLGIQDTLELFTGRQYFENVFISGYTDFIFGTNNTTLFKGCTIHVIDTVKDDNGTAGYLTAFKGSNKGESDAITYGAIFYQCKFTADEGVMAGKTAIGRTWGAHAAVAVIESEIGGHISVSGYSSNKNERYISMNGIVPTDATVQFVEYGNTGAGALTEAVAGMKMLTAEEAALYTDIATIFGKTNRGVSWLDTWDPAVTEIVLDDRTYYNFDRSTSEGTSHTFPTDTTIASGSTLEWAGLLISAEAGKVAWNANANALNMKAGAFIKFTVPAGTEVTVITYPGYNYFTLNGVGTASSTMLSQHYAEETEVTLLSTGDLYIYQIVINPGEEAPAAPTLTEIKVSGLKVDYNVGEEFSLDGVKVNAVYSDNSVRPIAAENYTVDSSSVNKDAAGEYTVSFTSGTLTASVTVTYIGDTTIRESTTIDLSATGAKIEGTTGNYKVLTVDATSGKFADNNGGWVQVNAGTIISFEYEGNAEVSVTAYNSAANFTIETKDGVCTITCTANDYLKAIAVKIAVVYNESTTIDLSATGAKIEGSTGVYGGLEIDATSGKFADNGGGWVQVNAGTIIKLNVADGATVSLTTYSKTQDKFTVEIADGVCTITCTESGDYLKAISIVVPVVYNESTTIDLSATGAHIEGSTGVYEGLEIDATSGKFADNNGGWVQVNAGTVIKLRVADGATVSLTTYSETQDKFTVEIADGVCTITCTASGDYLSAITVAY